MNVVTSSDSSDCPYKNEITIIISLRADSTYSLQRTRAGISHLCPKTGSSRKKISPSSSQKLVFFDNTFTLLCFFDLVDKLITGDVSPENRYFRPNTVFRKKKVVPVAIKAQVSQNRFFLLTKFHTIRSSVYPADIITAVIISIEQAGVSQNW